MSVVAEYTRETWERQGEWRGVERYVSHVLLLFPDLYDDDELTEEEYYAIRCGDAPARAVPYQYFERSDDNEERFDWLEDGADHMLQQTYRRRSTPVVEEVIE